MQESVVLHQSISTQRVSKLMEYRLQAGLAIDGAFSPGGDLRYMHGTHRKQKRVLKLTSHYTILLFRHSSRAGGRDAESWDTVWPQDWAILERSQMTRRVQTNAGVKACAWLAGTGEQ